MNKAVFLDRDGVINRERGTYTYLVKDFELLSGVCEALTVLQDYGYKLIVITNQGGINKGIYTKKEVLACHDFLQESCGHLLDDIFYSPYHDDFTCSLSRKPNTLMLERAIALYDIDVSKSWMVGDSDRDILAGRTMKLQTALVVSDKISKIGDVISFDSLLEFTKHITNLKSK